MNSANFEWIRLGGFVTWLFIFGAAEWLRPFGELSRKTIWQNRRLNAGLGLFNVAMLAGIGIGGFTQVSFAAAQTASDSGWMISLPATVQIGFSVLLLDYVSYGWHWLNHHVSFLWRFHRVHHTDPVLDVTSSLRFHPVEVLLSQPLRILVIWIFGIPLIGLLGFEIIFMAFNIMEHSYTKWPRSLEKVAQWFVITPALHRTHHSMKTSELNSNFGTVLSLWDRGHRTMTRNLEVSSPLVGLPEIGGRRLDLIQCLKLPTQ